MGRRGGRRNIEREKRFRKFQLKSEKGYLLISTLFLLMFSGLFSQAMIRISGNQIIQLRQVTSSYQAKSALNMSKALLQKEFQENKPPKSGSVRTSEGTVKIEREEMEEEYIFMLTLTTKSDSQYTDTLSITIPAPESEEEADETDFEMEEEIESKDATETYPEENIEEAEIEDESEIEIDTQEPESPPIDND